MATRNVRARVRQGVPVDGVDEAELREGFHELGDVDLHLLLGRYPLLRGADGEPLAQ
jgi:hypothetical protein